jgi:hypothetical protein
VNSGRTAAAACGVSVLDERDEELAAARETNRRLMNQLNRSGV